MKVNIVYMDGKNLDVELKKEDSENFFQALGQRQFYYDEEKKCGFWSDIDKVRYITVQEDENEMDAPKEEAKTVDAVAEESPKDDEEASGGAEREPC